jgi:hypothetical protein
LLLLVAAAAYATSLAGVFVYDDLVSILENGSLRRLAWEVWWPPAGITTSGRPLANFTFALNYLWGGEYPTGYHVVNWAIHGAAGVAFFGAVASGRGLAHVFSAGVAGAPVWSINSCSFAVIEFEQAAEAFAGLDLSRCAANPVGCCGQ